MKILSEYEMSKWAFMECLRKDNEELSKLINIPLLAFAYCTFIKCRPNIREKVNESDWNFYRNHTICINDTWYLKEREGRKGFLTINEKDIPKDRKIRLRGK